MLGQTLSAPLKEIARITNVRSDNFYAEALLRTMGEQASGWALYDSCLIARRQVLEELVPDPDGLRQVDGCGLSRMNYVSPEWMVRFLQGMQQSPAFDAFLGSLADFRAEVDDDEDAIGCYGLPHDGPRPDLPLVFVCNKEGESRPFDFNLSTVPISSAVPM